MSKVSNINITEIWIELLTYLSLVNTSNDEKIQELEKEIAELKIAKGIFPLIMYFTILNPNV